MAKIIAATKKRWRLQKAAAKKTAKAPEQAVAQTAAQ
jgi:hypothetical protein